MLSRRSTQLTLGLHFAIAKPAPEVFAVQSGGLCPSPGLRWSNAACSEVSAPSSPCSRAEAVLQLLCLHTRYFLQQRFCSMSKALPFYKRPSGNLQFASLPRPRNTGFTQILDLYVLIKQTEKNHAALSI